MRKLPAPDPIAGLASTSAFLTFHLLESLSQSQACDSTPSIKVKKEDEMEISLNIEGMTCGGCKAAVERILLAQPGISMASVDLANGSAIVTAATGTAPQTVADALTAAGYTSRVQN